MQPILLIGLVGVAAAALGTGFLMNTEIMLNVQQFGFGNESLFTPISDANVDLSIEAIEGFDQNANPIFKNVVDACSFHYPFNANFLGLDHPESEVICKLTDINGNVIAEGTRIGAIQPSQPDVSIAITELAFDQSWRIENIHDVTIVALRGFSCVGTAPCT